MEVYVDDILVKSRTAEQQKVDLSEAFQVMHHHDMRFNSDKCAFGIRSGKFLGFIVHQRGIEANL